MDQKGKDSQKVGKKHKIHFYSKQMYTINLNNIQSYQIYAAMKAKDRKAYEHNKDLIK